MAELERMGRVQRVWVLTLLVIALALSISEVADAHKLKYRFYRKSCPRVEKIVFREVKRAFRKDPTIAAGILRLNFHDCFVRVRVSPSAHLLVSLTASCQLSGL